MPELEVLVELSKSSLITPSIRPSLQRGIFSYEQFNSEILSYVIKLDEDLTYSYKAEKYRRNLDVNKDPTTKINDCTVEKLDNLTHVGEDKNEHLADKKEDGDDLTSFPPIADDIHGHLAYKIGDGIKHENRRYRILDTIGKGTYGKVLKVKDLTSDVTLALKVVRNGHAFREVGKHEVNIWEKIQQKDPSCIRCCGRMLSSFNYRGHTCLVFELLGSNVFDFLQENNYHPYPMEHIRHISYQLCYAVKFLHECKLTHTDVKPENICFESSDWEFTSKDVKNKQDIRRIKNTACRLIDLGSAKFDWDYHPTVITSSNYRAPEVILELGWSQPCDVWSIGCIMFELYTGVPLFQSHENKELLAIMTKVLGQIPSRLTRRTKTKYFKDGKLLWSDYSSEGTYVRYNCRPLMDHRRSDLEDDITLFNLISKMLHYDPETRISLAEVLRSPFFDKLPIHQVIHDIGFNVKNGM